jgi:hexosaminidase
MKNKVFLILFLSLILMRCKKPSQGKIQMTYTIEKFDLAKDEMNVNVIIENNSLMDLKGGAWELHWNQMKGFVKPQSLAEGIDFEWINGAHYFVLKFGKQWKLPPGESIQFSMQQQGIMDRIAMGPVGVFIVQEQQTTAVATQVQWKQAKGLESLKIPTAQDRYATMEGLKKLEKTELNWIVPTPNHLVFEGSFRNKDSLWSVDLDEQFSQQKKRLSPFVDSIFEIKTLWDQSSNANFLIRYDPAQKSEAYHLTIAKNIITLNASDYSGIVYGLQSLRQIITTTALEGLEWPLIKVDDSPRFGYRGFLLDIARNFYGPKKIKEVLDLMGLFKLNRLDFRLTDDEGWRIEIPDLPELTDIGAKRGYSTGQKDRLIPMYGSGANGGITGNGYLKRIEFIELLKFAHQRAIKIMPQISFPSHARAAIKAMDQRYENPQVHENKDEIKSYQLSDPDDQSKYRSAQNYNDNIICICQESAYHFYEKVVGEILAMYKEAEVPIDLFSIGADELPYGVWTASPICQDFIANNTLGISNVNDLYQYNLKRLKSILEKRNLTMAGWEDILLDHSEKSQEETQIKSEHFNYEVIPYVWNNSWGEAREDMIYKFANLGFRTVMSNSSAFYFDMTDDKDMENFGLNWSGYVDYRDAWGTDPENVFANYSLNKKHGITSKYIAQKEKLQANKKNNLLGVQSQLWTETVRSASIFDELLLPNLPVFSERAWSARPHWMGMNRPDAQIKAMNLDWNLFANMLGQRSLPLLNSIYVDIAYDLPKPGAIIENDMLKVSVPFPGLVVRYTTNGLAPNQNDKLYQKPISIPKNSNIVLRTFDVSGRGGRAISLK